MCILCTKVIFERRKMLEGPWKIEISDRCLPVIFYCLCGSELEIFLFDVDVLFLNCLCGSELNFDAYHLAYIFLNCLCGSERIRPF